MRDDPKEVFNIGYGLLKAKDPRDAMHQLMPDHKKARRITVMHWSVPSILDQGSKPHCVGFAGFNYLRASPVRNKPTFQPADLYATAQTLDEWPGTNYEGTSVRGLFKGLQQAGYVRGYSWAADADDVLSHVLTAGPVVLGTDWYQAMDRVGPGGFIWPEGGTVGGHAYLVAGADRAKKCPDGSVGAVRIVNSWGTGWGQKGRAWLSYTTLNLLIQNLGEACVAEEVLA